VAAKAFNYNVRMKTAFLLNGDNAFDSASFVVTLALFISKLVTLKLVKQFADFFA
jgi:hypothetical protein